MIVEVGRNEAKIDAQCFLIDFWCNVIEHFKKLLKLKVELLFDLTVPLLGLYLKNPDTPVQKNLCTPVFIAAQFIIAKC